MKVKYDVENHEIVRGDGYKYWQEKGIIAYFIASTHRNAVFEYDSNEEARAAGVALGRYIGHQKLPVKSIQRKNKVFIIHKDTEA